MHVDLASTPIIAILRGIDPQRCIAVGDVLYRAGIRVMEVPLNSPDPFASIEALRSHFDRDCVVGAGTVLTVSDVQQAQEAGAQLIVAPTIDTDVIRCALQLELEVLPGIATPTEAFQAIRAGATGLKLFPASTYGPQHLKALKAVLPANVRVFPVGGIGAQHVSSWIAAGASGFGFGSELFTPALELAEIEDRARRLVSALEEAKLHTSLAID